MTTAKVCERVVGAYNLDQKTDHKEIVVVNSKCPKVEKGILGRDIATRDYVSNVTILELNPKTGRYDKKKIVYTLPDGEKFSEKLVEFHVWNPRTELDEKAVSVADMNNDGKLDLVIKTSSEHDVKQYSSSKITVLYNHGNLEFKQQIPKKPK